MSTGKFSKAFDQAAGPPDLNPIDFGWRTRGRNGRACRYGDVAGTATNFVDERARTGFYRDLRADAVAIGFQSWSRRGNRLADGVKRNPMIAVAQIVHHQHGWRVHVADHRGDAAIIPQIADRQSARGTHRRNHRPRVGRNIGKGSVAVVAIEIFGSWKLLPRCWLSTSG